MIFHVRAFDALHPRELHALMALRQQVFVVEQKCPYLDADEHDLRALHLWVTRDGERMPIGGLRILPPGEKYAEPALGRIVTAPSVRRTGVGRAVVVRGLDEITRTYGPGAVRISAQQYLERFYGELGFVTQGEPYLEDDIPHVEMLRPRPD